MKPIFEETFFLSAGEVNAEQELSLAVLTSKLIEIATAHANSLRIGNPDMKDLNGGWVLSRLTIEMYEYPRVNEHYSIATWIESFNRHFSERAFRITSSDGEKIFGYGRSIWMVINTIDHSSVPLTHLFVSPEMIDGSNPPIERQAKHFPIVGMEEEASSTGVHLTATQPAFDYRFKYCDLDFYRHVNTVRYVTLLLNRFSLEEHDKTFINRLELSFLHEASYGMETELLQYDSMKDDAYLSAFLLRKGIDKSPLFFARMFRKVRPS